MRAALATRRRQDRARGFVDGALASLWRHDDVATLALRQRAAQVTRLTPGQRRKSASAKSWMVASASLTH